MAAFAKSPRKGSEAYFDRLCRASSNTIILKDAWLYEWAKHPPDAFLKHKTVFQKMAPAEVTKLKLGILEQAAREIAKIFKVQKPAALNDATLDAHLRSASFEWLALNRYPNKPCLMGIYDNYVVAAASLSQQRQDFTPVTQYKILQSKGLKNLECKAGYRHFCARFNTGYYFSTERQGLECSVSYSYNLGVHGMGYIWPIIGINGFYMPIPCRITTSLENLTLEIDQLNRDSQRYIEKLDWEFLHVHGGKAVYNWLCKQTEDVPYVSGAVSSLHKDSLLSKCKTKLDVLLAILQTLYLKSDDDLSQLLPLMQKFEQKGGNNVR